MRSSVTNPKIARRVASLLSLTLLNPALVHAGPVETIVLVRSASTSTRSTENHMRDELRLKGWYVHEITDPSEPSKISSVAAEQGAFAALRIDIDGGRSVAQVWLRNRGDGDMRLHWIDELPSNSSVAAIKIAEQVCYAVAEHSFGVSEPQSTEPVLEFAVGSNPDEFVIPEPPLPPEPNHAPALDDSAPSLINGTQERTRTGPELAGVITAAQGPPRSPTPTRRRWAGVAGVLGGAPGGAGLLAGISLSLGSEVARGVTLQTDISSSISPAPVFVAVGSFRIGLAGVRLLVLLTPFANARVSPFLGIGGGPTLVWSKGDAPSPLLGTTEVGLAGTIMGMAGVAVRLTPRARLRIGVDIQDLIPRVGIRAVNDSVAHLGLPIVQGRLGIEWGWKIRRRKKSAEPSSQRYVTLVP